MAACDESGGEVNFVLGGAGRSSIVRGPVMGRGWVVCGRTKTWEYTRTESRYEEDTCMFSSQYGRDAVENV
jgi:hypothetical protein